MLRDISAFAAGDPAALPLAPAPSDAPGWIGPAWLEAGLAWAAQRRAPLLVAACVFQMLVLGSMGVIQALPHVVGTRIWVRTYPVDPRDFFRGDFVVLRYEFSTMTPSSDVPVINQDRPVFITLQPDADGRHWHATEASWTPPTSGLYLRGVHRPGRWGSGPCQFGIEAFFVQESEGRVLEEQRNANNLSAELVVAPWGQAKLVRLAPTNDPVPN